METLLIAPESIDKRGSILRDTWDNQISRLEKFDEQVEYITERFEHGGSGIRCRHVAGPRE